MRERLDHLRAASLTHLRSARSSLATHRSGWEVGVVTTFALMAAYALGSSSLEAAARYEQETRRHSAVAAGLDRWTTGLQPVTPAESAAWLGSVQAIETIDAEGSEPTAIARIVAARAEEAGITNLAMRLVPAEELMAPPPKQIGSWSVRAGSTGLGVEFLGDWPAVIGFFGALPIQVEIGNVQVEPGPEFLLRVRAVLLAREVSPG